MAKLIIPPSACSGQYIIMHFIVDNDIKNIIERAMIGPQCMSCRSFFKIFHTSIFFPNISLLVKDFETLKETGTSSCTVAVTERSTHP